MSERIPAEVWPLASFLCDEMEARGWTSRDVAARFPYKNAYEYGVKCLAFELLLCVQNEEVLIGDEQFADLAIAFDVSEDLFRNLHRSWKDNPASRVAFECPEHLLTGGEHP